MESPAELLKLSNCSVWARRHTFQNRFECQEHQEFQELARRFKSISRVVKSCQGHQEFQEHVSRVTNETRLKHLHHMFTAPCRPLGCLHFWFSLLWHAARRTFCNLLTQILPCTPKPAWPSALALQQHFWGHMHFSNLIINSSMSYPTTWDKELLLWLSPLQSTFERSWCFGRTSRNVAIRISWPLFSTFTQATTVDFQSPRQAKPLPHRCRFH